MHSIDYSVYVSKLKRCFMGKAIGGTLGMPLEGFVNTKEITYYEPVPTTMLENDDLDLQVAWLEVIKRRGLPINRRDLAEGWLEHIKGLFDEYGVAVNNLEAGIYPPLSGYYNNKFFSGMGSAIRTEIWAALAPGDPELAIRMAKEDACVDHYSDGIDGTVFLAAIESLAYVEKDRKVLIEKAMSFLNTECRLYKVLSDVKKWWYELHDVYAVREKILTKYYRQNWTDVSINVSYIVLAYYAGEGDFSKSICIAASLGHDADCTTATLGALLGILIDEEFEERWTKPLGDDLVLSAYMTGMHAVDKIDKFCEQITELCIDVQSFYNSKIRISGKEKALDDIYCWGTEKAIATLEDNHNLLESLIAVRPLVVKLLYPKSVSLKQGEEAEFKLEISHPKQKAFSGSVKLKVPYGWKISENNFSISAAQGESAKLSFNITAPVGGKRIPYNPLDVNINIGDLEFCVTAGLVQAIDFLSVPCEAAPVECPKLTEFASANMHSASMCFSQIPDEARLFCTEFRPSTLQADAVLLVQGSGEMKVWLDDKLVLSHDGFEYVPAFHRSDYVVSIKNLSDFDWHRLTIWVGNKNAPREENNPNNARVKVDGTIPLIDLRRKYEAEKIYDFDERELFVGIAERAGWHWVKDIEWRLPKL